MFSRNARVESAPEIRPSEAERWRREVESLLQENLALREEIARLTQDNDDLRESAKIWLRLYESHLARANRADSELAGITALV